MSNFPIVSITSLIVIGIFVCNKLLDRSSLAQKDKTIKKLENSLTEAVSKQKAGEQSAELSRTASEKAGEVISARIDNAERFSSLAEQARRVVTEQEAVELARRQVEENR